MSWEWRSFWNVADSTSLESPERPWVRSMYRVLRHNLNSTVVVLARCEALSEMHLNLGDVNYSLRVHDPKTACQTVELSVCRREENGLRSWRPGERESCSVLEGDGLVRRRVVRNLYQTSQPEVVALFEQQKKRMQILPIGRRMGSTMPLNVHLAICRSLLVCHDGVEIEVCEIVARHCGWRSLWRSVALQGSRHSVSLQFASPPFRAIYEEQVQSADRAIVGGWPHFISYICAWLISMN